MSNGPKNKGPVLSKFSWAPDSSIPACKSTVTWRLHEVICSSDAMKLDVTWARDAKCHATWKTANKVRVSESENPSIPSSKSFQKASSHSGLDWIWGAHLLDEMNTLFPWWWFVPLVSLISAAPVRGRLQNINVAHDFRLERQIDITLTWVDMFVHPNSLLLLITWEA